MNQKSNLDNYDEVLNLLNSESNQDYIKNLIIPTFKNINDFMNFVTEEQQYLLSLIRRENNHITIDKPIELFQLLELYSLSCLVYLSELSADKKSITHIQTMNRSLFIKKNKDYGGSFEDFGYIGIIVRINDKINRLKSLYKSKTVNVNDESFEDTIHDLYNYTILGLMYKENK